MPKPKTPLLTVDCVLVDAKRRILMIRRGNAPYKGRLALPGGFVDIGESVEDACRRELEEETGVALKGRLKLVGVYSDPKRDPRGHTCSVVYLAKVRSSKAAAGDDAAAVKWVRDWKKQRLAFDHAKIVADAMKLMRKG